MSAMAGLVTTVGAVLVVVAVYCVLCFALLFLVEYPDDPPFQALVDLAFAVTVPFVLTVVLASVVWNRYRLPEAG